MNVCGSSRDDQEHFSTDFFVHYCSSFSFRFKIVCVVLAKPKWCKLLSLVHALELPEQLFSEARQFLPQLNCISQWISQAWRPRE